jgi:hypothetical protein
VFVIVGRLQVDGEADLPAVHALQDQLTLTPLSVHQGGVAPAPAGGVPGPDARVSGKLEWWERFRVALQAFPPPAADASFLQACERLGLTQPDCRCVDPEPELRESLVAGEQAAKEQLEELITTASKPVNCWQNALHLFDYNLDHFEIGAIDAPEWKITDRGTAYVTRAVAARVGLWGNHGYEAAYELVYVDADDQPLAGEHAYRLHLPVAPPVDAFWSLTMCDPPAFYLVANPIERYSIGDRTPGLKYGADGSLTIHIQHDSPGPEKESNWLPAPDGAFRPALRMYQPRKDVLDGRYILPAIQRVC